MNSKLKLILKILATISIIVIGGYLGLFLVLIGSMAFNVLPWMLVLPCLIIPSLLLILLWKREKKIFKIYNIYWIIIYVRTHNLNIFGGMINGIRFRTGF